MKSKYYKKGIFFVILLACSACDTFTEVELPPHQLTGAVTYQDASTAYAALADVYARIRDGGVVSGVSSGSSYTLGLYADELTYYGIVNPSKQFYDHSIVASNTYVSGFWNNTYGQIYAANAIIKGVEESEQIQGEDRNRLLGEALFIRAYLHFYLVNLYGDIPYVTEIDYKINAVISKSPVAKVYQKIIDDLIAAKDIMPETYPTDERVRPSRAVVYALLARVSLYNENYDNANLYASEVINNLDYSWEDNLENVFLKDSPAIIWALHPGYAGNNTKDAKTFVFSVGPPFKSALSSQLIEAFESGDLRREEWIRTITDGSNSWYHAYKYKKIFNTTPSVEYTILLRLAEQYLIRGEARAHLGDLVGAKEDINKIRNRAGLPEVTTASQQQLLAAFLKERRVELFTEQGHRWFDLKRTGTAAQVLAPVKPAWNSTQVLLPLPQDELLLNHNLLPQNPGY